VATLFAVDIFRIKGLSRGLEILTGHNPEALYPDRILFLESDSFRARA
jgi:hypothetical protein